MTKPQTTTLSEKSSTPGWLALPSLVIARFAAGPPYVLVGLLLIDIGTTFDYSVGIAGQLQTIGSLTTAIMALGMGALSVRFQHKSLLLVGLLVISISAIGCSIAWTFPMLLLIYALSGVGLAMITPMALAIVGTQFPLEKRTFAVGWVITGAALGPLLAAPLIGFVAEIKNWHWAFFSVVLPIALLSFLLAMKGVPKASRNHRTSRNLGQFMEGFKSVFNHRSAVACLIGMMLIFIEYQIIGVYMASFLRERFGTSPGRVSLVIGIGALSSILGNLTTSRIIPRIGRKRLIVGAISITSILVVFLMNVRTLWLAVVLYCLWSLLLGIQITTTYSLTLEQVPQFRGTLMSLNSTASNLGGAIGAAVGGAMLIVAGYNGIGIIGGIICISAAFIFYVLTDDPTINPSSDR